MLPDLHYLKVTSALVIADILSYVYVLRTYAYERMSAITNALVISKYVLTEFH